MKEFIIDPKYYYDIQYIISIAIKRYSSENILQDGYTEMAAALKGVKHRNELAYSPNLEEITIRLNRGELWNLKLAIDDLINDPCGDIASSSLSALNTYLKQFDVTL